MSHQSPFSPIYSNEVQKADASVPKGLLHAEQDAVVGRRMRRPRWRQIPKRCYVDGSAYPCTLTGERD